MVGLARSRRALNAKKAYGKPWALLYGFGACTQKKEPRLTVALADFGIMPCVRGLAGAEALCRNNDEVVRLEHFNGLIDLVKAKDHNGAFGLALHKGIHVFHVDAVF